MLNLSFCQPLNSKFRTGAERRIVAEACSGLETQQAICSKMAELNPYAIRSTHVSVIRDNGQD